MAEDGLAKAREVLRRAREGAASGHDAFTGQVGDLSVAKLRADIREFAEECRRRGAHGRRVPLSEDTRRWYGFVAANGTAEGRRRALAVLRRAREQAAAER